MICDNRARCRQIIPDFPDSLTPTVIMWPYSYSEGWCTGESEAKMRYKDKECIKKVQGLAEWGGSRVCREPKPGCVTRPRPSLSFKGVDSVEWVLAELGIAHAL